MHATRAAVEEGILPGGGVALLRASEVLGKLRTQNDDQKTGVEIVRKALSWPDAQILGFISFRWSARSPRPGMRSILNDCIVLLRDTNWHFFCGAPFQKVRHPPR
jgi:chaperonin GroEL (HSP60 family)